MSDIFFVLFLAIFFIGWVLRGYFSRKSPDYKKSLGELKRQPLEYESRLSFGLQVLFGLFLFVGLIMYVFYTPLFPWIQLPLLDIARWIGVAIGLVSLPLVAWVQSTLGASFSKTLTIQDDHKLVTTGPYSRIRHPMYSVYTFWFLSWFLISTNLLFGISWLFWVVYLFIRIPQEEQMLIEQFGDSYRDYMNKTGKLFPRF
ncbi:MAG: isoprenylcysteine carboxylmethyltransferase family protein [Candidatus Thorarchaeota archaeon]|jgi:protein-S-isoprenylcysteine O-methyltransferase Ste14